MVDHFGEDQTTSRIALAACGRDVGGSVVALALAHAACEDGQRVLVVDCDEADPTLSKCIAEQKGATWPERRRVQGRDLRNERDQGEVVLVSLDKDGTIDSELDRLSHFDMVLLYCGTIDSTAAIVNRWNAADAIVLVAKGRELDSDIVDELEAAGLANLCIGAVLTSDEDAGEEAGVTDAHAAAVRTSPTGSAAKWLTTIAVVVSFCVSPMMLSAFGVNYDTPGGNPLLKLHPANWLFGMALLGNVVSKSDPVRYVSGLPQGLPRRLLLLADGRFTVAFATLVQHTPVMPLIDTFFAAVAMLVLYDDLDETMRVRLRWLAHLILFANASIGIVEFLTQTRLTPFVVAGVPVLHDYRSTALFGHPLVNAGTTAGYVLMLFFGGHPAGRPFLKAALMSVQLAALVAFGGRTAIVLCGVDARDRLAADGRRNRQRSPFRSTRRAGLRARSAGGPGRHGRRRVQRPLHQPRRALRGRQGLGGGPRRDVRPVRQLLVRGTSPRSRSRSARVPAEDARHRIRHREFVVGTAVSIRRDHHGLLRRRIARSARRFHTARRDPNPY